MIRYVKYQNNGHIQGVAGKWYLRVKHSETVDLDGLAEHMAQHNTPYSKGAIKGILEDMVKCIQELLLDSKKVKLPNLGIFAIGIKSYGSATAAEATVEKVHDTTFNFQGTGDMSEPNLLKKVHLKEQDEYAV